MYSDMIYSGRIPERLFLLFHDDMEECIAFTDNKKIIKQLIKERGDKYYYMEVKKHDIKRVLDYLTNSNSIADELEVYTVNKNDIRNILTYPEYEMFYESFSVFMAETDMAIEKLDELLPFIRFTEEEKEILREFYAVMFGLEDNGYGYDHPSEIDFNEERAISFYVKQL